MIDRVQLFVTCLVDTLFPDAGEAAVAVLERLGLRVEFPAGQTCCGQPAFNGGFRAEARAMARHWLDVFEASDAPIVVPSGSCAAMVVHGYAALFDGEHEADQRARARAAAARTYEFSQFLVDVLEAEPAQIGARFEGRLAYHPSCHLLRDLRVIDAPQRLLLGVAGAELRPLPGADECCGFGGLFAVKHAELSGAILDAKVAAVRESGAHTLVGCDVSCLMHIQGGLTRDGLGVRCRHLAEVLAGR